MLNRSDSFSTSCVAMVVAGAMLSGCIPAQGTIPPSEWHPRFVETFATSSASTQCHYIREMRANGVTLTEGDLSQITAMLSQSGMTRDEIAFAFSDDQGLRTGLTYREVRCIGGTLINSAFYPGIGHVWQMQLGSRYVYLNGNGEPGGMRVTSWN